VARAKSKGELLAHLKTRGVEDDIAQAVVFRSKRLASSTIVNSLPLGLHLAIHIRSYQSASSLENFVRRALLKSRLMKRSMASMMNLNIALPLI